MTVPGMAIICNAVENASIEPISDAGIMAILRGEPASGSHLRALFEDVTLSVLSSVAASSDIPFETVLSAYRAARQTAIARQP